MLSKNKCRLSLSGWFHGKSAPRSPLLAEPALFTRLPPSDISEEELVHWINAEYISPLTQSEIQEKFEDDSEIQLSDFIPVSTVNWSNA